MKHVTAMIILVLGFCVSSETDAALFNKILVSYNNHVLTLWDMEREIAVMRTQKGISIALPISNEELKSLTKKVVVELLVTEEAQSFKIGEISETIKQKEFENFRHKFKEEADFKQFMNRYAWSETELKNSLIRSQWVDKFIKEKILSVYVFLSKEEVTDFQKKFSHFSEEEARNQLRKKRIQENLRDWIEGLKIRYHIVTLWE